MSPYLQSLISASLQPDAPPHLKRFMAIVPNASTTFSSGQVGLSYDAVINKLCNLGGLVNKGLSLKPPSSAVEVAFLHLVMLPSQCITVAICNAWCPWFPSWVVMHWTSWNRQESSTWFFYMSLAKTWSPGPNPTIGNTGSFILPFSEKSRIREYLALLSIWIYHHFKLLVAL